MAGLVKYILFGNFWSFLLVLSGLVDIIIGILVLTGVITTRSSGFPVFIVCLATGLLYFSAGLAIAIFGRRKRGGTSAEK